MWRWRWRWNRGGVVWPAGCALCTMSTHVQQVPRPLHVVPSGVKRSASMDGDSDSSTHIAPHS